MSREKIAGPFIQDMKGHWGIWLWKWCQSYASAFTVPTSQPNWTLTGDFGATYSDILQLSCLARSEHGSRSRVWTNATTLRLGLAKEWERELTWIGPNYNVRSASWSEIAPVTHSQVYHLIHWFGPEQTDYEGIYFLRTVLIPPVECRDLGSLFQGALKLFWTVVVARHLTKTLDVVVSFFNCHLVVLSKVSYLQFSLVGNSVSW